MLLEITVKIEFLAYFYCLKLEFVRKWGFTLYHVQYIISQKEMYPTLFSKRNASLICPFSTVPRVTDIDVAMSLV